MFNLFVLAFFLFICFSYDHKAIGRVSFIAYAIYVLFIAGLDGFAGFNGASDDYFYHLTALMNTCVAYLVYGRYRVFALLSFSFIPLCFIGRVMYVHYYSPVLYDTLAVTITILQVLLLGARVMIDAVTFKGTRGRALVRILNFDSFQQDPERPLFEKETIR